MDTEFMVGDIVRSLSGHDKNRLFVVLSIDKNGYPVIIDGRYRVRSKPKTKNPKHLLKVAHDDKILQKVSSPIATDTEIYKMIKVYKQVKENIT